MFQALADILLREPGIGFALVFGSAARGTRHAHSDVDIAIGGLAKRLSALELGDLTGRLELAVGCPVDLVVLDEAPSALAYRVFRDGRVILVRDPGALAAQQAKAVLEYLDWRPMEDILVAGSRGVGRHGR